MDFTCTAMAPSYRSLKMHLGKRQYQYPRISVSNKRKGSTIRLGGNRRRSWRIRVIPRLKVALVVISQVSRVLKKLWDGYTNVALVVGGDVGAFKRNCNFNPPRGGKRIPKEYQIDAGTNAEQPEDKFVSEIYKQLKAYQDSVYY